MMSCSEQKKFTVLLCHPDWSTDGGEPRYSVEFVRAATGADAARKARERAAYMLIGYEAEADDFLAVSAVKGWSDVILNPEA